MASFPSKQSLRSGCLTISLDFEIIWGVLDNPKLEAYKKNLEQVPTVVDRLLRLFEHQEIHATWSTVGLLFLHSEKEFQCGLPSHRPNYTRASLCPYRYVEEKGTLEPRLHFQPNLIRKISETPGQEIGSHTYSHFYCLEDGSSVAAFRDDTKRAVEVASACGCPPRSLVFPRNQCREDFLAVLTDFGIRSYRGNENHWIYEASNKSGQNLFRRALRLTDSYLNLTGHHTFGAEAIGRSAPFNLPASRFLRPYSRRLALLEPLRIRRIKSAMKHAAIHNEVFHLWWHPHNFGSNLEENIDCLQEICAEFEELRRRYGFYSLNMAELTEEIDKGTFLHTQWPETVENL